MPHGQFGGLFVSPVQGVFLRSITPGVSNYFCEEKKRWSLGVQSFLLRGGNKVAENFWQFALPRQKQDALRVRNHDGGTPARASESVGPDFSGFHRPRGLRRLGHGCKWRAFRSQLVWMGASEAKMLLWNGKLLGIEASHHSIRIHVSETTIAISENAKVDFEAEMRKFEKKVISNLPLAEITIDVNKIFQDEIQDEADVQIQNLRFDNGEIRIAFTTTHPKLTTYCVRLDSASRPTYAAKIRLQKETPVVFDSSVL